MRTLNKQAAELRARAATVAEGPVLDVGTPVPFYKELAWLEPYSARPYFCSDVRQTLRVDFAADVRALPIASGSVGAVICQGVCNYLPDPQAAVNELHRVLRPGGRAYVGLPAISPYTGGHPGFPGDVLRFAPGSAEVLFAAWTKHETVPDGRLGGALLTYAPARWRPWLRPLRVLDRLDTNITARFCVFAVK